MGSIFGGSKNKQESGNKNMGVVTDSLSPAMGYAAQGGQGLAALLGGDASGFNTFKDNVGYDWELGQGMGSIAANNLSRGLGDSGATLKALAKYQTGLNNTYLDKYISGQGGLADIGLGAAGTVGNVGQWSKGSQSSGGGLGGLIGAGLSGWATGGFK